MVSRPVARVPLISVKQVKIELELVTVRLLDELADFAPIKIKAR